MDETLLTCLTPAGRSAMATLALRGPQAWIITRELFRRGQASASPTAGATSLPEAPTPGKFWLGMFGEPAGAGADEIVVLIKETDPVPWIELHCHGGPEVVRLLEDQLESRGARLSSWPDFQRAHLPAWQAAAEEIVAHAPTARTAAIALDQWHGAFRRAVEEVTKRVRSSDREGAWAQVRNLAERIGIGRHLVRPWRIVLAGPPNVGKSSLANALAGFARSVVAPTPGTTRDVVTTLLALDGWPVELCDTAGLHESDDVLEQAGMARAQAVISSADLTLWLLDGAAAPVLPPPAATRVVGVINKTDLPAAWNWDTLPEAVRVSALTSAGLPQLSQAIVARLVPLLAELGDPVPYTEAMCVALEEMCAALQAGNDQAVEAILERLWASPGM